MTLNRLMTSLLIGLAAVLLVTTCAEAQRAGGSSDEFASRDMGEGPFDTLIIRGVYMIDGLGGPTQGPMVITVEGNRIASIQPASRAPAENDPDGAHVIDATGKYIMPGFINCLLYTSPSPRDRG